MYLYNQTPHVLNNWKSVYELFNTYVFNEEEVAGPRKLQLQHLKTYEYKVYVLIKSKNNP